MLRARDAMDRQFADPLDIPALARIAHVSEAHFIRTFRATFGETPHRYLQRRRVERAMALLCSTDRSITDICMSVGFSSLGTFSRTFRDIVGESPKEYRAAQPRRRQGPDALLDGVDEAQQFRRSTRGQARIASLSTTTQTFKENQMSYQAYLDAIEKKTDQHPAAAARRGRRPRVHPHHQGCRRGRLAEGRLRRRPRPRDGAVRRAQERRHDQRQARRQPAAPTPTRPPSCGSTASRTAEEAAMFTNINVSQIFVLDQDEALDFYVGKLGLEVHTDVDLGFMRWLTVNVPGHPDREILLERPGPPSMDEDTAAQVRELVSKGVMGGWVGFVTDDCRKTYDELAARGVEFTDGPNEQPYGIDAGIRDPFGNKLRFVQPRAGG